MLLVLIGMIVFILKKICLFTKKYQPIFVFISMKYNALCWTPGVVDESQ